MEKSPAFRPPMNTVPENDPQIVRVKLDRTDWGARKSAQPMLESDKMQIRHVPNGR